MKNFLFFSLLILTACSSNEVKKENIDFLDNTGINLNKKYSLTLNEIDSFSSYSLGNFYPKNIITTKEYYDKSKRLKKEKYYNRNGEFLSAQCYYNNENNTLKSKEIIKNNISYIEVYSELGKILVQRNFDFFNSSELAEYEEFKLKYNI